MTENFDRRGKSRNFNKLRNLPQYKNMSDDELMAIVEQKEASQGVSVALEKRIEEKLAKFSEDYDLSDLKINDREVLRGLIQAIIALEDYEQSLYKIRTDIGVTPENILLVDKIQKVVSDLRSDISKHQNDLNITRKIRKSDQESSVIAYIEKLKQQARDFYESRMAYIVCPKCSTLLATVWTLFSDSSKNKIVLVCEHKNADGTLCGEKVIVTTKELLKNRGANDAAKEVLPESLL